MKQALWQSLVAIAVGYPLLPQQAAKAGWIQDGIDAYQRSQQQIPDYYVRPGAAPLNPIDRNGFGYINNLGGGTDDSGNYRQPVPTRRAVGVDLPDGSYEAPANWDENLGIRYRVQGGAIVNQGYQFYPRGRR